jgi:heptaprenyl diphosphate synthase
MNNWLKNSFQGGTRMKLIDIYKELKSDLQMIEDELHQVVHSPHPFMQETSLHLLKAGGKRIRPVFVLLGGKNGTYDLESLKYVAVALELIHMATLVHDDVIDNADKRRGKQTVKAKWDNRIAMYTGDYIFAKALHYMTNLPDPRLHQILSRSIVEMCRGEIEQIKALYQWDQTLKTYFLRIKRKTALLMAISCQLGAISCQANDDTANALYRYGYNVGMAFQITDDILDFTGTEKQLGKPAGSDILQGNITLPVLAAFKDPSVKEKIIGEFQSESPDMNNIIKLVKSSGGIDFSKGIAKRYLQKASHSVQNLTDEKSKRTLMEIAEFIGSRSF